MELVYVRVAIFVLYVAYFVLDGACTILLAIDMDRHYEFVSIALLATATAHIAFLFIGWIGSKWDLCLVPSDYETYPYDEIWTKCLFVASDILLAVAIVMAGIGRATKNRFTILSLLVLAAWTNVLCFYKFYWKRFGPTRTDQAESLQQMPRLPVIEFKRLTTEI